MVQTEILRLQFLPGGGLLVTDTPSREGFCVNLGLSKKRDELEGQGFEHPASGR